ncbi:glycosyltransferase family 4 protein [Lysobacter enzymogenes]|uniref:glycosyltransferase family 4 protein n=1 Tax=Lysobacter enzymogenes TaxID=69 RepID=UPI0008986673|nr:glycosyltransferase family 4 protein [Lysobacter enzymogenes]SDW35001.1 Glycosyltransferase involved in cell wall bisynthesis [Lysobacter enzymogenes]
MSAVAHTDVAGQRILVMSHRHPDFSLGGGEIAAYQLYRAYREAPGVDRAWFLASCDRGRGASGAIVPRRKDEYLWEQGIHDWTMLKAAQRRSVTESFAELLSALRPTIVHAHHYAHLGMEFLRVVKDILPSATLCLTLHEYMAICHNQGQMIRVDGSLCSRESFDDCRGCFPQLSVPDLWRRKHFIQRHFDYVDHFVSPSKFLRQRYIDWGLPAEKISVIENGQGDGEALPPRPAADGELRARFGYFGQINPYKGLHVLLKALRELPKAQRSRLVLEVHGANLDAQSDEFRNSIRELAQPLIDKGVVQWIGPYRPHELRERMAGVDWVVVPSVWWENSPMVIQEAFVCGRPLLVSDIGGMAEKVRDGVDGLHVGVGNARRWGDALLRACDPDLWRQMASGIRRPDSHAVCARKHLEVAQCVRTN